MIFKKYTYSWKRSGAGFLALLSLLALPHSHAIDYAQLPDFGDSVKAQITDQMEQELAQQLIGFIYQSSSTFNDPIVSNYVKQLTKKLAQSSQLNHFEPKLFLIKDTSINAFAGPGNVIGVHAGLFIHAEKLSEFASVMAHELGHLNYKHFALMKAQADKTYNQLVLPVIASLFILLSGDGNTVIPAIGVLDIGSKMFVGEFFAYSRQLETEADIFAIQTLIDNNIDPNGIPDFFQTLLHTYGSQTDVPSFALSHPISQNRISYTRARINDSLNLKPGINADTLDYQLIRARVLKHSMVDYFSFEKNFQQFQQSKDGDNKILLAYQTLLAYDRSKSIDTLNTVVSYLQKQAPLNVIIAQSIADAYLPINQVKAKTAIDKMLEIAPESQASQFIAYEYHLQNGNAKQASTFSQALKQSNTSSIYFWQLETRLHRLTDNMPELHLSLAEIELLKNRPDAARQQLAIAREECGSNFICKSTIDQRFSAQKL